MKTLVETFRNAGARGVALLALTSAFAGFANAAEVPAGTILDKSSLDKLKGETFDGHVIGSLLTERVEWQIRNTGLTITLDHAKPYPSEPRFIEATKKYADRVKFDAKTREVTGYVAGLPFPSISAEDPNAGDKLMWNYYYAVQEGDTIYNKFFYLQVDAKGGVQSKQDWIYERYYFKGRLTGDASAASEEAPLAKTMVLAQSPEDLKGIGIFQVKYDASRFEETYGYLKSARRTRRLSGGAWMDAVGGTDVLADDFNVWNARPSWYKSIKIVGKRWVLAITDARKDIYDPKKAGTPGEFPTTDLKNTPFWNPIEKWQPREVYVVEAIPPVEHPYSKKVMYVDIGIYRPYFAEAYDRKGEFWKFVNAHSRPKVSESGVNVVSMPYFEWIDFKAMHATIVPIYVQRTDLKGVGADHWSLSVMEQLAK